MIDYCQIIMVGTLMHVYCVEIHVFNNKYMKLNFRETCYCQMDLCILLLQNWCDKIFIFYAIIIQWREYQLLANRNLFFWRHYYE